MAESTARPVEGERDGDLGVMSVVVSGRWSWLGLGTCWGLLLGGASWLTFGSPVRWFTSGAFTVLALVTARLAVPHETLTLEADALVSQAGSRTIHLPLGTIDVVERQLVPNAPWHLWVGASGTGIQIQPGTESLALCLELGRRLEPRRRHVRVADDAAELLGWEPPVGPDPFERRPIDVVVGSAPRAAVQRAVLEALASAAVQTVVGDRVIAQEDRAGWRTFCGAIPWEERVTLLGLDRDPLAVIEPGGTTVRVRLTASELAELTATLPEGSLTVPVTPPPMARASRRFVDRLTRFAGWT